jgi:type III pantothenate kinase
MYLLIDVGNTRIKWLLLEDHSDLLLSPIFESQSGTFTEFEHYVSTINTSQTHVLLAAVNQTDVLMRLLMQSGFCDIFVAESKSQQSGLQNSYSRPERMGVDRWLAMIAAYSTLQIGSKQPADTLLVKRNSGVIVVDAGSALTIDVVSAQGVHLGGYIVPGILMAQRALFQNTDRVIQYKKENPLSSSEVGMNKLGNNTLQCVEYGVINQLAALVKSVVGEYSDYELVITGGDSEILAKFFPAVRVERDLVLKGLWQVRN